MSGDENGTNEEKFETIDTNQDGVIDLEEFKAAQQEQDVVEEALPSKQLTVDVEAGIIPVATKIVVETEKDTDGNESTIEKVVTMENQEIWEVIYDDLSEILINDNFSDYSIDDKYEFGGEQWIDERYKFNEAHEFQSCNEILNWFFGASRNRDSIEWLSNLGSGDHGVDSYILQKDPEFNFFGLTIIQSKLHAMTTGEKFPNEPSKTMDTMIRAVSKIVKKEAIGKNAKYLELKNKYDELCLSSAMDVPVRAIIITSKQQTEDSEYAKMGNDHGIRTIEYNQLATLIGGKKSVTKAVDDWELSTSTPFVMHKDAKEPDVHLAIVSGEDIFNFIHSSGGKRKEEYLHYNVRLSLLHSSNKKKKELAEAIRNKVDETLVKEPEKFLPFNNGLVICHVGAHSENKVNGTYCFKEPMLVNGGQTVQAILDHGWDDDTKSTDMDKLENVYVPVKFVSVDNHDHLTVQIAEAANNQNPVGRDDLLANDPRLQRIQEWLRSDCKEKNVWLELQEGSTGSLKEAGKWKKDDYSFQGITRSFTKEDWIRMAFAAAGSGYKQSKSKEIIWGDFVIDLAFTPGAKRNALSPNSYEGKLNENMFFNDNQLELAETVLLAQLVHGIFDRISSWHGTRKNKSNMPDLANGTNPDKENAVSMAEILTKIPFIGVGLFFDSLYSITSGDRERHKQMMELLIDGPILTPITNSSGKSRPSHGLVNAFRDKTAKMKWLNKNTGKPANWHVLVDAKPYTTKAEEQKVHNLVKWCWEIAKRVCEVYANHYSNDVRSATETDSDNFIRKCKLKIGIDIHKNDVFPQTKSNTSTSSTSSSPGTAGGSSDQTTDTIEPIASMMWKLFNMEMVKAMVEGWDKVLATLEKKKGLLVQLKANSEKDEGEKKKYDEFVTTVEGLMNLMKVSDFVLDDWFGEQTKLETDKADETKDEPETVEIEEKSEEETETTEGGKKNSEESPEPVEEALMENKQFPHLAGPDEELL